MKIGILSLQGDFAAHAESVRRAGSTPVLVKNPHDLEGISGLILPGGESTTHIRLLERAGLQEPIRNLSVPLFGTCAGLILLASRIIPQEQFSFGFLPITAERNAYGSQKESFIEDVSIPALGTQRFPCVFIRAPKIAAVGPEVDVLATLEESPIFVRYRNFFGATFHPELTEDLRVHKLFLETCNE